jgi:hypothetical protein
MDRALFPSGGPAPFLFLENPVSNDQDNGQRLRTKRYCEKYDVSRVTVWRWIRDGKLPAERVGNMVFLPDRLPVDDPKPA